MSRSSARNMHFDELVNTRDLRWLGQNTNHAVPHETVREAMKRCLEQEEYHIYAPPAGLEELRHGVVSDLGLPGQKALISDGGIAALYHICHVLLRSGDELVTTDPTWQWPLEFAKSVGASVTQIPIYGSEHNYRLSPKRLTSALTKRTKLIYLVDPNNPLGTCCTPEEIKEIVELLRERDAYLIQDCTYRDFAFNHTLAATLAPDRVITIYSFSKWLGLAGLRVGAVVASESLIDLLATTPPNSLGSNILAQRAAIAGLRSKKQWFPDVLTNQRRNQEMIKRATDRISGLNIPVFPSNGNYMIVETENLGIKPEALAAAYQKQKILIRHGGYHTRTFGHRFIKVSTSVPSAWIAEFIELLPKMLDQAAASKQAPAVF
jgi:aspartate/methionine/tyrosine aminotransferase